MRHDARTAVADRWAAHRCERVHDTFDTCFTCRTWASAKVAAMSDPLAEAAGVIEAWLSLSKSSENLAGAALVLIVQDGSGLELVWPVAGRSALNLQELLSTWAREFAGQVIVTALGDEHVCVRPHTFFARWPEA
ncbi:hypothetical protein [Sanguibacter sp. HDW7]|uniref:hypothetical protein n=1 Tax=Sanguibacter sp. HDW7 TaxID=2714931 RepID=UPI00140DD5C2|nr:hypothetical protein [Sanguibacter sp. HDW7]QIK83533.1 hypothetical protein G7063_07755 [Sanguibacter sp. HDW7]